MALDTKLCPTQALHLRTSKVPGVADNRNLALEGWMNYKRGKSIPWHYTAAKTCTWAGQTREGMEAQLALSCSGALIPAVPVAGDNWGRDGGILCACQSCAIATRADGAGTARRDLPVRRVNTQSSFKALSLNTLTASLSTQSRVWTVGKFGLRPSLEAALKIQRGCSDGVSSGIAWPRNPAPVLNSTVGPARLPPHQASSPGNRCSFLPGLLLQGRRS